MSMVSRYTLQASDTFCTNTSSVIPADGGIYKSISTVNSFFELDKCLDSGGSCNYNQFEYDYKINHVFKENHKCN